MENNQTKLTPKEVFNNKKLFSNKIHARVLQTIEEISTSFEKLAIVNDADKRSFLSVVNHYYQDLCAVIFHLRKVVIQIDGDDQESYDLQDVITELNNIALSVQECLNLETEKLKIQLKSTIVDVGSQVEKLMKIVQYDNLHEHKQKVLDCQHDLVISLEALKLYNQLCYLSAPEFEGLIHEVIEKIKYNLIEIKDDNELLAEDFSHYTRHIVKHMHNNVDYMRKMNNIEYFQDEVSTIFKSVEVFGTEFISEMLEAVCNDNPMNNMLNIIENCHKKVANGSNEFKKWLQSTTINNIGKKGDEGVKQLIIYLFINLLKSVCALNQSIEDAIMKK